MTCVVASNVPGIAAHNCRIKGKAHALRLLLFTDLQRLQTFSAHLRTPTQHSSLHLASASCLVILNFTRTAIKGKLCCINIAEEA